MRFYPAVLAASLAFVAPSFAQTSPAPAASSAKPTVAEAQAFMQKAEADILDLLNQGGQAQWLQETDINDDSEAIGAKAAERLLLRTN